MFQSSQPLVHVLYHKANELVHQCVLTFIKPEVVAEKEGNDLFAVTCEDSKKLAGPWKNVSWLWKKSRSEISPRK